jgi:hypothetical protein
MSFSYLTNNKKANFYVKKVKTNNVKMLKEYLGSI